jgi:NAD(P)-dependent dehydrogenase (short-subunit alcohol dehydrogenase family)
MSKKVLVVGGTGTIGQAVVRLLSGAHQVISVSRSRGAAAQVDITDGASIQSLFESVGKLDAVVSAAGDLHFGPLTDMTAEMFRVGLHSKVLGQVNLALTAQHFLNDGGSITLTSAMVAQEPIRFGANATACAAAIEGFVRAAAVELPRGLRINAVSPSVLQESLATFGTFFPGIEAAPGSRVAMGYLRSIDGVQTGRVFRAW